MSAVSLIDGWYLARKGETWHNVYWHYIMQYFTIETDDKESNGRYAYTYFDEVIT